MSCLLDALHVPTTCGCGAASGDEVFRGLMLARIIESATKLDSLRILEDAGRHRRVVPGRAAVPAGDPSYRTVKSKDANNTA